MRLFAALELPKDVKDAIAEWWIGTSAALHPGEWRDVPKENWHLTLGFFGDVNGGEVVDLAEALEDCAARSPVQHLCLRDVGMFPNLNRPKVFWIGVAQTDDGGRLKSLAHCCRRAARATVRKRTAKDEVFRGHVTLARRRGEPFPVDPRMLAAMPDLPEQQWQVDTIILYQSELRPDGARYRVLEEFELAAPDAYDRTAKRGE
ncbi:MAG TPA: RNA 2',3'-cyclic phosphodiesterase [Mariprofundaceae bacterium]|nr:RNA 2',3'-cyclic phosphodiesterase [Mariprofundaceae bacterium]